MDSTITGQGVGHSVLRKEDDRYMRGRGLFVADIRLAGMQDLAFVRSPLAHARIRAIRKPPGFEGAVFTAADLIGREADHRQQRRCPGSSRPPNTPWRPNGCAMSARRWPCASPRPAPRPKTWPSWSKSIWEELPAVSDMLGGARARRAAMLHEHWGDNIFLESFAHIGERHRRRHRRRSW